MIFQPTKQQLEELGFTEKYWEYSRVFGSCKLTYVQSSFILWNLDWYMKQFYLESIDNIKTLIRLLSPNK